MALADRCDGGPMSDHKSRNWQRLAHARCDQWLLRWRWPGEPGQRLLSDDELRELLRAAYTGGYRDGRDSKKTDRR